MIEDAAEPRTGTQTIERAVDLLRYLAMHNHAGSRLSAIAEECHLRTSTAHRILAGLTRGGLVMQRPGDRRYVLGPMLFELGLSAMPERLELQHAARIRLAELARKTQSIAKLFFRSGDDFVCSVRVGDTRISTQGQTIYPGSRRPLVYAAGGAAILLALPRREAFAILRRNLAALQDYSAGSAEGILRMVRRSYRAGLAVNEGYVVPGITALGMGLCDAQGEPFASISIAAPQELIDLSRLDAYRQMLEDTARQLWARPATVPKGRSAAQ